MSQPGWLQTHCMHVCRHYVLQQVKKILKQTHFAFGCQSLPPLCCYCPHLLDYDCILHVNPGITNRGLAMVFNPTSQSISRNISLPLYYSGISEKAIVMKEGVAPGATYTLDRDYRIEVESVVMAPKTITWFLIQSGDANNK